MIILVTSNLKSFNSMINLIVRNCVEGTINNKKKLIKILVIMRIANLNKGIILIRLL